MDFFVPIDASEQLEASTNHQVRSQIPPHSQTAVHLRRPIAVRRMLEIPPPPPIPEMLESEPIFARQLLSSSHQIPPPPSIPQMSESLQQPQGMPVQCGLPLYPRPLSQQFDINDEMKEDLNVLSEFHLVFIIDDSGSMSVRTNANESRWQELTRTVSNIVLVAQPYCPSADIAFLNNTHLNDVYRPDQVPDLLLSIRPHGATPLLSALRVCLREAALRNSRTLLVVCTDGEPTDGSRNILCELLKNRDCFRVPICFVACADDEHAISYLNCLDVIVPYVAIIDDFLSEATKVRLARGTRITRSEYSALILLAAIMAKYDEYDKHPARVCVVCGIKGEYTQIADPITRQLRNTTLAGSHKKDGWHCAVCVNSSAKRAPPGVKCHICKQHIPDRKYIRWPDSGWNCVKCKPSSSKLCIVM